MKIKICSSCKAEFQCKENSSCWCYELPHTYISNKSDEGKDCICPKCLEVRVTTENGKV